MQLRTLRCLAAFLLAAAVSACPSPPEKTPAEAASTEQAAEPSPYLDKLAQKQSVADIRLTGTALFSWLTDQIAAGAAGQSQAEPKIAQLQDYRAVSVAEIEKLLVPQYLERVPKTDGWGHPYEYFVNPDPRGRKVIAIRSLGRDGQADASEYTESSFLPEEFDRDLVWIDGYFVRWPQAPPVR